MATAYAHGIVFVCPVALVSTVLDALDAIMPRADGIERDPAAPRNYGLPLSATGTGSPTHYLSNFVVNEATRAALESAGLGSLPGVSYWRISNPDGILATTNHPASVATVGQPFGWVDALTRLGLQEIPQEPPA